MADELSFPPFVVRWTIGDVSTEGFEALRLSICGAVRLFGDRARYVVCVNTVPLGIARDRVGDVPDVIEWRDVTSELWPHIRQYLDTNMAEGVAWKFAPLRIDERAHELALDNDCILWTLPDAVERWITHPTSCVVAEDVRACFGQFSDVCGTAPRNTGIRAIPAGVDFGRAVLNLLAERSVLLSSELDEQGLQVAAMNRCGPVDLVPTDEVSICSPFPPHQLELGRCGAHFVGLNAKDLPWQLRGRPASAFVREHWAAHRPAIYQRLGIGR